MTTKPPTPHPWWRIDVYNQMLTLSFRPGAYAHVPLNVSAQATGRGIYWATRRFIPGARTKLFIYELLYPKELPND